MRVSVVLDCRNPEALVHFWEVALGYRLVDAADGYRILAPTEGETAGPVLILQPVPEPKLGKNRMHLDVHPDDPLGHISTLEGLGARKAGAPIAAYGVEWQTMVDPEGHEFCVVAHGRLDPASPDAASAGDVSG